MSRRATQSRPRNSLAGIMWMRQGVSWRPTVLLAQHASVSSESDGARYVMVLTKPFDVIREFKTYVRIIRVDERRANNQRNEKNKNKKNIFNLKREWKFSGQRDKHTSDREGKRGKVMRTHRWNVPRIIVRPTKSYLLSRIGFDFAPHVDWMHINWTDRRLFGARFAARCIWKRLNEQIENEWKAEWKKTIDILHFE